MLIHIGYPKTATTWLQKNIFYRNDRGFIPLTGETGSPKTIPNYFCDPKTEIFSDCTKIKNYIETHSNYAEDVNNFVISYEGLASDEFYPNYEWAMGAEKLKSVFPEAKILIGIREQKSMIFSLYFQYLSIRGWRSLKGFLKNHDYNCPSTFSSLEYLRFDRLILKYQELYGKKNVFVYPYEVFDCGKGQKIIEQLAHFYPANIPLDRLDFSDRVNTKRNMYFILSITRHLGLIIGKYRPLSKKFSFLFRYFQILRLYLSRLPLPKRIERIWIERHRSIINNFVGDYYKDSNQRLEKLCGLKLKHLGYDL